MKGKWNYDGLGKVHYGHHETYEQPAAWFDEIGGTLEDWGCGCAVMKEYVKKCKYVGIEGSKNEYADRCDVELADYISSPDCLFMRHVIDHNIEWRKILTNALNSFKRRMVLVIFHDPGPETKVLFRHSSPKFPGVPDLQFALHDLYSLIIPYLVKVRLVQKNSESPNNETAFYLEKK